MRFSVNIWAAIVKDHLIGPQILAERLNGAMYLNFLQNTLPELLENIPLQLRACMWYQDDGAPAHFDRMARAYLADIFRQRVIGRECPVSWPARSPDLTPPDF